MKAQNINYNKNNTFDYNDCNNYYNNYFNKDYNYNFNIIKNNDYILNNNIIENNYGKIIKNNIIYKLNNNNNNIINKYLNNYENKNENKIFLINSENNNQNYYKNYGQYNKIQGINFLSNDNTISLKNKHKIGKNICYSDGNNDNSLLNEMKFRYII